jgi:hypothetical protein
MFLLALILAMTLAQRPADVVHWSAVGPNGSVRAGETATIKVSADIESGWHLYALTQPDGGPRPLEIKAAKGAPLTVVASEIAGPVPKVDRDPNVEADAHYYDERVTIAVPVVIPAAAPAATQRVALEITYQACSGRVCLRPSTETVRADVSIVKGKR